MAKIEKGIVTSDGFKFRNKVTIDIYLTDKELDKLLNYRTDMENRLDLPIGMEFTLDDAVTFIVGKVMSAK